MDEADSATAREIYERASPKSASAVGYVEAVSALTRGRNGGRLSAPRFDGALGELEVIWSEFDIHTVTPEVIQDASRIVIAHGLRAYDSLHLATALTLARVERIIFVCWDRDLRNAAERRALTLLPEQL